jgi:E3 ubiquitin-protein ligase mind-bomb
MQLKFNADVNAQNSEGQTPLHLAIAFGSTESAAELITFQGTDFRLIDHLGNHVLHECILNGAADLFHAITERLEQENKIGFLINESNQDGNTLLHLSEIHSRSSIKQLLLDNYAKWGIDSNSKKNKKGQTPTQIHEKLIEREREIEEMKVVNRKERLENE